MEGFTEIKAINKYQVDIESIITYGIWKQVALLLGKDDYEEVRSNRSEWPNMEDDQFFHWEDTVGLRKKLDMAEGDDIREGNPCITYSFPILSTALQFAHTSQADIEFSNKVTRAKAMQIADGVHQIGVDYAIVDTVVDARSRKPPFSLPAPSANSLTIFFF